MVQVDIEKSDMEKPLLKEGEGSQGITMDEIAKHNTKGDAWIALNGQAIDVTKWIPVHPGGEQIIMSYMGKDASVEWNTIHKPGTVEKFAGRADGPKIMGPIVGGGGGGGGAAPPAATAAAAPPVDEYPPPPDGDGGIPGIVGGLIFVILGMVRMLLSTIFFTSNFLFVVDGSGTIRFKFDNHRNGTIRSAIMLLVFTIVHVAGNSFDFWVGGAEEMNGETYFFERQQAFWPVGKKLNLGPLEAYLLLALGLHVSVALKRTWDINAKYGVFSGKLNMCLSGLFVLAFLIKHLKDFKYYDGYEYAQIRAPAMFVNPLGLTEGHLWIDPDAPKIVVKDVYTHEFAVFKDPANVAFYLIAVTVFAGHMILGWSKVITADALQIPTGHLKSVKWVGWIAIVAVASLYASLPVGTYFSTQEAVEHFPKPVQ